MIYRFVFQKQHLPSYFTRRMILLNKTAIDVLDQEGVFWPIQVRYYNYRGRMRWYLYKGWNEFSNSQRMEEGQVWIFQLIRHGPSFGTSGFKAMMIEWCGKFRCFIYHLCVIYLTICTNLCIITIRVICIWLIIIIGCFFIIYY